LLFRGVVLMVKPVKVLTDAEFAVFRKYACVRCGHFGYCSHCGKLECPFGLQLTEVPCVSFVRNVDVHG
jgi:hypothetical protein